MEKIERAVRDILEAVGEDPDREGLQETPARVARMYGEIFSGLGADPKQHLKIFTEGKHDELVLVKDIPLYSVCEHHLLPFIGRAHIAYIPKKQENYRAFQICPDCGLFCPASPGTGAFDRTDCRFPL